MNGGIKGRSAMMAGFTLIEMMISFAISLILIAGILSISINSMKSAGEALKRTHLTQEVRAVINLMVNDLRRAGFNGGGVEALYAGEDNTFIVPPYLVAVGRVNIASANTVTDCVTYAYDENKDGLLGLGRYFQGASRTNGVNDERNGFRLRYTKVQRFRGSRGLMACDGGGWEGVTSEFITVTELAFNSNELCYDSALLTNNLVSCAAALPAGRLVKKLHMGIHIKAQLAGDARVFQSINDSVFIDNYR